MCEAENLILPTCSISSSELSNEACAVWSTLPESIKQDPSLVKFKEQYQKHITFEYKSKAALEIPKDDITRLSPKKGRYRNLP